MAERADLTVDWGLSPRLIEVALPSVIVNNQDLHDTLKSNTLPAGEADDSLNNMDDDQLIESAGKENLGGGNEVGITSTLLNGQVAFGRTPPRHTTAYSVTSASSTQFIASGALLQTIGAQRGDWILNWTDQSITEILEVLSETTARVRPLTGMASSSNDFAVSDLCTVWGVEECELSGGNTVALAADLVTNINPLFTTFGRFATRASASQATATIAELEITNLQFLIESLRGEHRAYGEIFYWDPVNGNDNNAGTAPDAAVATFAAAQQRVTANNADVIFMVNTSGAALTVTERLSITKNDLILRGPGSSILLQPLDDAAPTISVTADNVSISGFKAITTGATPQSVIDVTGNAPRLSDIWINDSTEDGIHISNAQDAIVERCTIESAAGSGLHLVDTINAKVFENRIQRCTGDGITLEEVTTARDAWIARNVLHHNGNAINIGVGVSMTMVTKDNLIGPPKGKNFADLIIDNGSGTHNEWEEWWDAIFETWQRLALDPNNPLTTNDDNSISVGNIVIGAVNNPTSTVQTRT